MATLTQSMLNLADYYKRTDPNGGVADIIEVLNDTSQDIFSDFVMMEANNGTSHRHTIRTGLPSVSWGALYEGVVQSKSATQQVDDTTGFVEALSTVDKRVLDLYAENKNAMRASESRPFIESMAQELVTALFYHDNATNVRLPKGLGARYGTIATSGAGAQVIDAGGSSTDNTSIWMVTWGGDGLCGLYPKGTKAGITQEDKGEQRVLDASGNPYYVVEEMLTAHMGFAIKDYRKVVRIANIDVSDLQAGSVDLYKWLRKGYYRMHGARPGVKIMNDSNPGRTVIYANRDVIEALDATSASASLNAALQLRPMELDGKEVLSYRGFPIRQTDQLLNTETEVV